MLDATNRTISSLYHPKKERNTNSLKKQDAPLKVHILYPGLFIVHYIVLFFIFLSFVATKHYNFSIALIMRRINDAHKQGYAVNSQGFWLFFPLTDNSDFASIYPIIILIRSRLSASI